MLRIYLQKDSKFWWISFTAPNGQRIRRSTRVRDKGEAERIGRAWALDAERAHADAEAGIERPSDISLIDLAAAYLLSVEPEKAKRYVQTLEILIAARILPHFGEDTRARTLTPASIEEFRRTLLRGRPVSDQHRGWPAVSAATANRYMVALRQMLAHGVRLGHLRHNPATRVKKLKERTEQRHRALSDQEIEALLQELAESRTEGRAHHTLWVRFLIETGLRASEAAALRWEDVRLLHDPPHVHVRAGTAKDAERRDVPLTQAAIDAIRALAERRGAPVGLVFGPFCRREALLGAWKRTGLPGRCPSAHDLRHTFASRCVAAGLSLAELKVIMGHDSIMTTERYIHTYGDTMHAVARKLNLRA